MISLIKNYNQPSDKHNKLFDNIKNREKNICLYCCGNVGVSVYNVLNKNGYSIKAVIDRECQNKQFICCNQNVISQVDINKFLSEDDIIIVCTYIIEDYLHIKEYLNKNGYQNVMLFTELRHLDNLISGSKLFTTVTAKNPDDLLTEHKEQISQAYTYIEFDDISKKTFLELTSFFSDTTRIPYITYHAKDQYFDYGLYTKIPDEIFVDCGAFNGDTLEMFLKNNDTFNEYYAIEPDNQNNKKIIKKYFKTEIADKIKVIPNIISNKQQELTFDKKGTSHSCVSDVGEKMKTVVLDEIFDGKKVTFIKMDIEGYEISALSGAREIIKKYTPVLAICAYHNIEHLWEIPILIKSIYKDYTLYLRNYGGIVEYVYYAVPPSRCR